MSEDIGVGSRIRVAAVDLEPDGRHFYNERELKQFRFGKVIELERSIATIQLDGETRETHRVYNISVLTAQGSLPSLSDLPQPPERPRQSGNIIRPRSRSW